MKKLLSFSLCLALAFSCCVFVGCGEGEKPAATSSDSGDGGSDAKTDDGGSDSK